MNGLTAVCLEDIVKVFFLKDLADKKAGQLSKILCNKNKINFLEKSNLNKLNLLKTGLAFGIICLLASIIASKLGTFLQVYYFSFVNLFFCLNITLTFNLKAVLSTLG